MMTRAPLDDEKVKRRELLLGGTSLVVSVVAVGASGYSVWLARKNEERLAYDASTNFNIIQNLWSTEPSFALWNESTRKLDQPPSPTYLMAIPVKVYWTTETGESSSLALLPVSYEVITEQVKNGETIGEIEKSMLPGSFFAKEGARDLIIGESVELEEGLSARVETLPFLLIVAEIDYSLVGEGEAETVRIVTTPLLRETWSSAQVEYLKRYFRDNAKYEIKPPAEESGESVYQVAHEVIQAQFEGGGSGMDPLLFGGAEDGYGFILKDLNELISPSDPLSI